jgi:hypothetical protein
MLNIDPRHRIVVSASAKAGSIAVVRMLYSHSGELERWPGQKEQGIHQFARSVERDHGFTQRKIAELLLTPGRDGYRAFKFVRNPYTRAVSGYLQVVNHARLYEPFRHSAADPDDLTFRAYLERINDMDLWTGDGHYRVQKLRFEDSIDPPWDLVARLEQVAEDVAEINRRFGFDLEFPTTQRARYRTLKTVAAPGIVADRPFRDLRDGWPPYEQFYDAGALELAESAYGPDLEAYGYTSPLD